MRKPVVGRIYGNCLALDRNGNSIFRCDARKMEWYIKRGLAEKISDDPPQIKLLFEAAGPGHSGDPFFLEKRQNRCVVCGTDRDLTRHHVIPHCYRRFFPRDLDRYGSYDVVPLCGEHHDAYEESANSLRLELAHTYDAPIGGIGGRSCQETGKAVQAAWAILRFKDQLPKRRLEEMERRVANFFGELPTQDELVRVVDSNKSPVKTHAEIVAGHLRDSDAINAFAVMWRRHFVETMRPQFMPNHWSIDRRFDPR